MPDSLFFDGTDDKVVCSMGNWAGSGAFTIACVLKFVSGGQFRCFASAAPLAATSFFFKCSNTDALHMSGSVDNYATLGQIIPTSDGWVLIAFSKASGADVGDFHVYRYTAGTWSHPAGLTNYVNLSGMTALWFGMNTGSTEVAHMNLLIAGFWDSELSSANLETMELGTQAWIDLSPDELFRFDRVTALSSITGTSAESSRTGTLLDRGDAPAGWVDHDASAPTFALDYSRFPKVKVA